MPGDPGWVGVCDVARVDVAALPDDFAQLKGRLARDGGALVYYAEKAAADGVLLVLVTERALCLYDEDGLFHRAVELAAIEEVLERGRLVGVKVPTEYDLCLTLPQDRVGPFVDTLRTLFKRASNRTLVARRLPPGAHLRRYLYLDVPEDFVPKPEPEFTFDGGGGEEEVTLVARLAARQQEVAELKKQTSEHAALTAAVQHAAAKAEEARHPHPALLQKLHDLERAVGELGHRVAGRPGGPPLSPSGGDRVRQLMSLLGKQVSAAGAELAKLKKEKRVKQQPQTRGNATAPLVRQPSAGQPLALPAGTPTATPAAAPASFNRVESALTSLSVGRGPSASTGYRGRTGLGGSKENLEALPAGRAGTAPMDAPEELTLDAVVPSPTSTASSEGATAALKERVARLEETLAAQGGSTPGGDLPRTLSHRVTFLEGMLRGGGMASSVHPPPVTPPPPLPPRSGSQLLGQHVLSEVVDSVDGEEPTAASSASSVALDLGLSKGTMQTGTGTIMPHGDRPDYDPDDPLNILDDEIDDVFTRRAQTTASPRPPLASTTATTSLCVHAGRSRYEVVSPTREGGVTSHQGFDDDAPPPRAVLRSPPRPRDPRPLPVHGMTSPNRAAGDAVGAALLEDERRLTSQHRYSTTVDRGGVPAALEAALRDPDDPLSLLMDDALPVASPAHDLMLAHRANDPHQAIARRVEAAARPPLSAAGESPAFGAIGAALSAPRSAGDPHETIRVLNEALRQADTARTPQKALPSPAVPAAVPAVTPTPRRRSAAHDKTVSPPPPPRSAAAGDPAALPGLYCCDGRRPAGVYDAPTYEAAPLAAVLPGEVVAAAAGAAPVLDSEGGTWVPLQRGGWSCELAAAAPMHKAERERTPVSLPRRRSRRSPARNAVAQAAGPAEPGAPSPSDVEMARLGERVSALHTAVMRHHTLVTDQLHAGKEPTEHHHHPSPLYPQDKHRSPKRFNAPPPAPASPPRARHRDPHSSQPEAPSAGVSSPFMGYMQRHYGGGIAPIAASPSPPRSRGGAAVGGASAAREELRLRRQAQDARVRALSQPKGVRRRERIASPGRRRPVFK